MSRQQDINIIKVFVWVLKNDRMSLKTFVSECGIYNLAMEAFINYWRH